MTQIPEWLAKKAQEAEQKTKAKAAAKTKAEVIQLPLWTEIERAIPNHLARSSLFAPIAKGRRKQHRKTPLVSRSDAVILFSGDQLDEADCDVWMQALHEARQVPLGEPVQINRAEFLRKIGRSKSAQAYRWLHSSFERLSFGMLSIQTKTYEIGVTPHSRLIHLINGFDHDPATDSYMLQIDPRMLKMFNNAEFALINWEKRLLIENRVDLAKRLQRLVATSSDKTQRYSLDYLKEVCCHEGRMRDFKTSLQDAMEELERLNIIQNPKIELSTQGKEQACWNRFK